MWGVETEADASAGRAGFIKHTQKGKQSKTKAKSKSNEQSEVRRSANEH